MRFGKIIGQEKLKLQLLEECRKGRLSHARLFVGKEGVGKMALALAVAQYINCDNPTAQDACGSCPSCVKYQKLIHPDLHFVFPVVKIPGKSSVVCDDFIEQWREFLHENTYLSLSNWYKHIGVDNKQGMIYAEESNEIIRKLSRKSYEGKYKVVIIWLPEKMHLSCANKLLKILEEPPQKTLFLMLSEHAEEVLPTIYSRAQSLRVPSIDEESLQHFLTNEGYSAEIASAITTLSGGSVTEAIRLLEQKENLQFNFDAFKNLMRFAYARNIPELYNWTETMAKIGRERQKQFMDYACRMVRENFMYNLKNGDLYRITPEEEQFSTKFAPFIQPKNVEALYKEFTKSYADITANGNAKIIFMDLCIRTVRKIRMN